MPTSLKQVNQNLQQKEIVINQNFESVAPAGIFSWKNPNSVGLSFSYFGGTYPDSTGALKEITDGTVSCQASSTNYIEFSQSTMTVIVNQTAFTAGNIPIGIAVTNSSQITSYTQKRVIPMLTSGSTGTGSGSSGGGSGGSTSQVYSRFAELTATNATSSQSIVINIKGGQIPVPGKSFDNTSKITVADFTDTGLYLTNDTFYYLEYDSSGARFGAASADQAISRTKLRKLLYVAKLGSDTTKVGSITDFRSSDIYLLNKTVLKGINYTSGAKSNTLDFSFIKGLQDSDRNYYDSSMTAYPTIALIQVVMQCKVAEKGFAVGDECPFITGNMLSSIASPYQYIASTGNVVVPQGSMVYVWNKSNNAYEVPTDSSWNIVVKMRLDI